MLLPTKPSKLIAARVDGLKERARNATGQADTNLLASRITSLSRGEAGASTSSRLAGMKARVTAPAVTVATSVQPSSDVGQRGEPGSLFRNTKMDLGERLHDWLVARLLRLRRELDMIDEIGEGFPMLEEWSGEGPNDVTRGLTRLLAKLGNALERKGKTILPGLVFLLAREKAHFNVWGRIRAAALASTPEPDDADHGLTRTFLTPTWTSAEAAQSTDELEKLVDRLWKDQCLADASTSSKRMDRTEEEVSDRWEEELQGLELTWDDVVDMQSRFWPTVS